jgi:hypothetical protein
MKISVLKQKVKSNIAYKFVIDDPLNKPGRIFFITGLVECSFNFCHQQSSVDICLGLERLDCIGKLFCNIITRKPKGMLCQKSNN